MFKKLTVLTSLILVVGLLGSAFGQGTGTIMREVWEGIGGTSVSDLTGNADYPDNPSWASLVTSLEQPEGDLGSNFGSRIHGYLHPATSGDYTFWIAADDGCELALSTDADPANAVVIAYWTGWTGSRQWDNNPEQMSAPVALQAGGTYYISAVFKEGGGGDNLSVAWEGPDNPARDVIDGAFLSPAAWAASALKAAAPNPADGSVDVDVTALEWTAGPTAVSHKVYLSSDESIDDADLVGETELTIQIAILDVGATYYWRVDEVTADGTVVEGDVWSFTTIPLEAHFPSPEDGVGSQGLDSQLSWTAGKVVIMHDVYFGTDEAAIAARDMTTFKGKLMTTSYDPGALDIETTYYWAVDQFTPTGTVAGPVWSFTTLGSIAITDPDLLLHYDFENGEGNVALDRSGHSNHGMFKGDPQWVSGPFGGAVSINIDTLDYIETAGPLGITSNNISVTGWVKHDALPAGWSGILTHRGSGNLGLQHDGTELRYMWGADQYWDFSSGLELPVGEWYFAALTIAPDQGKLYLNGVEQTATNVAPHDPVSFDSLIRVGRDHNDGRIMTSLIDEVRLYNITLTDADIQGMLLSDVTAPGDIVIGDPNEARDGSVAGWPDGEYPGLAIDDDTSTKFLHFGGEVVPTGFVVEPAIGPTIVTGLTLTTANDSPNRDPASFELSGSNESIDGPYTLIASGDVSDFTMEIEWPRFTMNATAISFANDAAYKYYKVMFPTVRDPGSANSMQIAEVELLGVSSPLVAHWTFDDGDGTVALDSSGYGNDGVLVGDPLWVGGQVGGALEFDGIDDYVDCGNGAALDITGDITLMAWIKVAAFTKTWETILGKGDDSYRMSRGPGDGDSIHFGANGTGDNLNATTIVTTDTWRHVALVYDGADKIIYIDGVEDARAAASGNINSSGYNFFIGQNSQQSNRFLTGLVDDVRIYNEALSAAEVDAIANPPASIVFVSFHGGDDSPSGNAADVGFTEASDKAYTEMLAAEGYNVTRYITTGDPDVDLLNAADLVIISRAVSSGNYSNDSATTWNGVTSPMIILGGYVLRSSRMGYTTGTSMVDTTGDVSLTVNDPTHPIFAGIELVDGAMVNPFAGVVVYPTDGVLARGLSINNSEVNADGTVLAVISEASAATGPAGGLVIGEWSAGATMNHSGGAETDILAGDRLVFLTGAREYDGITSHTAGLYDLYEDGAQMYLNAVAYMLP